MLRLAVLVREHAEELADLCIIENGTPRPFAAMYPELVADLFEYNAGWADKIGGEVVPTWPLRALDYTVEEPYGVVGIIIPWNGPSRLGRHDDGSRPRRRQLRGRQAAGAGAMVRPAPG